MALRPHEPTQGTCSATAAVLALTVILAAPVLAAPDRDPNCESDTAPTLTVVETEYTVTPVDRADGALESRLVTRPRTTLTADAEEESELKEESGDDAAGSPESASTPPPKAGGPLVYKRQMYRRDI